MRALHGFAEGVLLGNVSRRPSKEGGLGMKRLVVVNTCKPDSPKP